MPYLETSLLKHPRARGTVRRQHGSDARAQRGVVLIIALILLVIMSLLATTSLRNASSSENISGNVRTSELAYQAAEIGLRHCEASATDIARVNAGQASSYATTITSGNIVAMSTNAWSSTTTWDAGGTATTALVLPSTLMSGTSTFKRMPECVIEMLVNQTGAGIKAPTSFVITARGFGPEVPDGTGRPQGSVVWLQSTLELP